MLRSLLLLLVGGEAPEGEGESENVYSQVHPAEATEDGDDDGEVDAEIETALAEIPDNEPEPGSGQPARDDDAGPDDDTGAGVPVP